jgi:hypothetical protein
VNSAPPEGLRHFFAPLKVFTVTAKYADVSHLPSKWLQLSFESARGKYGSHDVAKELRSPCALRP